MKNSTSASGSLKSMPPVSAPAPAAGSWNSSAGQVEREHAEDVGDRVLVEPQPGRRDERQRRRPPVVDARHLRRDHPAHRVADEVRPVEAERVGDVPAVEREVEHVLEQLLARRLAVAGQLGRVHA